MNGSARIDKVTFCSSASLLVGLVTNHSFILYPKFLWEYANKECHLALTVSCDTWYCLHRFYCISFGIIQWPGIACTCSYINYNLRLSISLRANFSFSS